MLMARTTPNQLDSDERMKLSSLDSDYTSLHGSSGEQCKIGFAVNGTDIRIFDEINRIQTKATALDLDWLNSESLSQIARVISFTNSV